jgi:hypothetical protein
MSTRVVELAGPAGAGKTTAVRALSAQPDGTRVGLQAGRPRTAAALARVTPLLLERVAAGRWWSAPELRSIGYLGAWRGAVSRLETDELVLLDHGPVFRLAMLLVDAPPVGGSRLERWWQSRAREWAGLLEAVVCLDASDEVLIGRIEERPRSHRVRGADRADAEAFLKSYREAFAAVLDAVETAGTRVFRVDTAGDPGSVADAIRSCLGTTDELDGTVGR